MRLRRAAGLFAFTCCALAQATYYPDKEWRTATPESQGLDSAALSAVLEGIAQRQLGVHSLLVIRHGYAVLDAYFYPFDAHTPHDLASVTKTMTSVLTGVAVSRKLLTLDRPLLSLFPLEAPADAEERKRKITVGNLLRMESGLDCGYAPGEQELERMKRSPDWVRFALGLPMKYDPGVHTSYCSPGYHLLGSAIGAAAHSTELEFAQKYLFAPLGIEGVVWTPDPQGRNHGWGDSHLFPRDIAKLGYLYLHSGSWKGAPIVPASWVAMSTALPPGPRDGPGGFGYEWNVAKTDSGLQYGGVGRGGQTLIVWPELDMVIVATGGGNTGQLGPMVAKAVKSNEALPENRAAVAALAARTAAAVKAPAAGELSAIRPMAVEISGVTYEFPVNSSRLDSLALVFARGGGAQVNLKYYGEPLRLPLGLDGVYRIAPSGPLQLPAGAKGKWVGDAEFQLDVNFIANINHYTLDLHFAGDQVDVTANEASGLIRNGHLVGQRVR